MNRRGFIGTLTALAGLALAKIKAPAADPLQAVTHPHWRRGVAMLTRCAWCEKVTSDLVQWTEHGSDGLYHSAAICPTCKNVQCYKANDASRDS